MATLYILQAKRLKNGIVLNIPEAESWRILII